MSFEQLEELLYETEQAYELANNDDDDWAWWYAEYLEDDLPHILGLTLKKSDICYWLKQFDHLQAQSLVPSREKWYETYASALWAKYHPEQIDTPLLSTEQMIEVDRLMIDDYHIELIQMMENAGRNLAVLAKRAFLHGNVRGKRIVVMAGTGGNGGGALVCARHLANHGADVRVYITKPNEQFKPIPQHQYKIIEHMGITILPADDISKQSQPDLIIDGVIGYSLNGAPRGTSPTLIKWANTIDTPILSLDAPSGLDTTTGTIYEPAIQATATMTLALPKAGLLASDTIAHVGALFLADISVPPSLYAEPSLGLHVGDLFTDGYITRLR